MKPRGILLGLLGLGFGVSTMVAFTINSYIYNYDLKASNFISLILSRTNVVRLGSCFDTREYIWKEKR